MPAMVPGDNLDVDLEAPSNELFAVVGSAESEDLVGEASDPPPLATVGVSVLFVEVVVMDGASMLFESDLAGLHLSLSEPWKWWEQ